MEFLECIRNTVVSLLKNYKLIKMNDWDIIKCE